MADEVGLKEEKRTLRIPGGEAELQTGSLRGVAIHFRIQQYGGGPMDEGGGTASISFKSKKDWDQFLTLLNKHGEAVIKT